MSKKAAIELSTSFLVTLIIAIVVFGSSVYITKKFFTHAETVKMTYDERTEKEIERLLDDGSKIAIPFDRKTIGNGEFNTFGIGILNILNTGSSNRFKVTFSFNKAFDKRNNPICELATYNLCGNPPSWLQTSQGTGNTIEKTVKNNDQEKFLLGVSPKNAPAGIYIFDLYVTYHETSSGNWISYDPIHKIYVEVP